MLSRNDRLDSEQVREIVGGVKSPPDIEGARVAETVGGDTNPPDISIITPCYNAAKYIRATLDSVRKQSGVRVEHIVVDANSTDGTVEILKEFSNIRWISEPDRGQSDAFNKGLGMARAPLIGWLNADDTYEPNVLAQIVNFFRAHPEAAIVNGHLVRIDESGRELEFLPARSSCFWLVHFWFKWYGLNHPSTFYRKEVFEQVGLLDTELHYAMDYDFYLRASRVYRFHDIDLLTTRMLVHPEAKTSGGWDRFARDVQRTLAKVWKPRNRSFYAYTLLGVRAHAARTHLVESFLAIRTGERGRAWSELRRAAGWWPPLFTLPSFYTYLARCVLRLVLGEARYARLRRGSSTHP